MSRYGMAACAAERPFTGKWHSGVPISLESDSGRERLSCHQSLNVGSVHPPQTQGNVQSAVRLALSGRYLLHAEALIGLIDRQTTS